MSRILPVLFALVVLTSTAWGQDRGRKGREGPGEGAARGEQMIQQFFKAGDVNRDGFLNAAEFNRTKAAIGQFLARRQQGPAGRRPGKGPAPKRGEGKEKGREGGREGGPNLAAFNSNPDKNNDKAVSENEFSDWIHAVMGIRAPGSAPEGERRRPERKEQD